MHIMRYLAAVVVIVVSFSACSEEEIPDAVRGCQMPILGEYYPTPAPTLVPDPNLTPTVTPTATPTAGPGTVYPTLTPTATMTPTPLPYCTPTPEPVPPTATVIPPTVALSGGNRGGGVGGAASSGRGVDSITINRSDQTLLTAATGPQRFAVAWLEGNTLWIGADNGADQIVQYAISSAKEAALAFNLANRLHLAYRGMDDRLYYRSAAADDSIAQAQEEELPDIGENLQLLVNVDGWPVLLYSRDGVRASVRQPDGSWREQFVSVGDSGAITMGADGVLYAAVKIDNDVRIYRQVPGAQSWQLRREYQDIPGLRGAPSLDAYEEYVYASWVTEQLDPNPNDWPRRRPEYKEAAPFVNRIQSGENAQQYFTSWGVHDAGVYQRFETTPGTALSASAYYMGWSCGEPGECVYATANEPNPPSSEGADMHAQICIDPTGGVDIYSQTVVCSGAVNSLDSWTLVQLDGIEAQGGHATIFLRTQPDLPRQEQNVYWDSITLAGGELENPGFEGSFQPWQGVAELKVAAGWNPFYTEDPPEGSSTGRYTVQGAYSADGGNTFSDAFTVAINADNGNNKTGSFAPRAYPVIDRNKLAPWVAFVFLYETGDPAHGRGMVRYGKPRVVVCELDDDECGYGDSGAPLVPGSAHLPIRRLLVGVSPTHARAMVAWDAYQGETTAAKDVAAMLFSPSSLILGGGSE